MTSDSSPAPNNSSLLQDAVGRGDLDAVRELLEVGTDPNGLKSFPLIHRAIERDHEHGTLLLRAVQVTTDGEQRQLFLATTLEWRS